MEIFSLGVKNVQSVESLEFDFPVRDSGGSFVTLVGPSSSGKSALLRAVHALVNNTSSAAVLLRSGAKKFEVGATFNQSYVKIERGASLSTYVLGSDKYTKSGTSVPDDIAKAIGFKDPDLHIRFQFDRPYLLDATSGQAATALAKLSHAHILRDAAAKASKIVRQRASEVSVLQTEQQNAQQSLEALGDVEAQGLVLEDAEQQMGEIQATLERAAQAQNVLTRVSDGIAAVESSQAILDGIPDVSQQFAALADTATKADSVRAAVQRYEGAQSVLSTQRTPISEPMSLALLQVGEKHKFMDQVLWAINSLSAAQQRTSTAETDLVAKVEQRSNIEDQIRVLRESIKVCPTCGQEVGASQ